jgi:hypothetical protein
VIVPSGRVPAAPLPGAGAAPPAAETGGRGAVTVPAAFARLGPVTQRAHSPRLQGATALAIYTGLWFLFYARALIAHPELPQLDQVSMDPNIFAWSLRWWPYAISHGLNPLRTNLIGAPAGFDLAWVTTVPPLALLAWPLTSAFGAVVSLNLLIAIAPPLAAWAAFVLCRRLTGRFWPALAGGIVYGFSAYEMNHTVPGHLNMTFSLLLPLMAYLVLLWRDGKLGRTGFVSWMAVGLLLQMALFLETFAELTLIWVAGLAVGFLVADRQVRPVISRLARQAGLAYLIALCITAPYLGYVLSHTPPDFSHSPPLGPGVGSLDLASLVVPRSSGTFGIGGLRLFSNELPAISRACYVGIPLLVLVVLLAVRTWQSRLTRFLVYMFVFVLLVAIGPELLVANLHITALPWAELWNLPIARSAFPTRIMVFGYLALAVLVAVWLTAPLRATALRWLLAVVAVAGILADVGPIVHSTRPAYTSTPAFISTGEYRHYLTPKETVLVVSGRGNAGLLWQADTDFYLRIAGGYVSEAITQRTDLPAPAQLLAQPSRLADLGFLAYLRRDKVGAILIEASWPPRWVASFAHLGLHGQLVGGVLLYRVRPCALRCGPWHHLLRHRDID